MIIRLTTIVLVTIIIQNTSCLGSIFIKAGSASGQKSEDEFYFTAPNGIFKKKLIC